MLLFSLIVLHLTVCLMKIVCAKWNILRSRINKGTLKGVQIVEGRNLSLKKNKKLKVAHLLLRVGCGLSYGFGRSITKNTATCQHPSPSLVTRSRQMS